MVNPFTKTTERVKQLGIPNQLSGAPECQLSGALDLSSQVYFLRSLPQSPSADHTVHAVHQSLLNVVFGLTYFDLVGVSSQLA